MTAVRSLPLAALLALVLAAPAVAQQDCEAPPGTAAIDQYCETVPSAGGERDPSKDDDDRSGGGGVASSDGAAPPPSSGTLRELRTNGADGQALAESLRTDARKPSKSDSGTRPSVSASADSRVEPVPSQSPVDAVKKALDDGPTVGAALPWALLAVALLMAGGLWLRLRAGRPESLDS